MQLAAKGSATSFSRISAKSKRSRHVRAVFRRRERRSRRFLNHARARYRDSGSRLILKDLDTLERRASELERRAKTGDKKIKDSLEVLQKLKRHLHEGRLAKYLRIRTNFPEQPVFDDMHLLTDKPVMYVANTMNPVLGTGTGISTRCGPLRRRNERKSLLFARK